MTARVAVPSILMATGVAWLAIALGLKGWMVVLFAVSLYMFGFGVAGLAANVADARRREGKR